MERPKKLQRVSLFTMALRHGLHKAHAELRLREGEADPILAAELIDHRWLWTVSMGRATTGSI